MTIRNAFLLIACLWFSSDLSHASENLREERPFDCFSEDYERSGELIPELCDYFNPHHDETPIQELYFLEVNRSLVGKLNRESIGIYRHTDGWFIEVFGYKTERASEKNNFKRASRIAWVSRPIKPKHGNRVALSLSDKRLENMTKLDLFGNDHRKSKQPMICTDGSILSLYVYRNNETHTSRRHSCSNRTDIDVFADDMIKIVQKIDRQAGVFVSDIPIKSSD